MAKTSAYRVCERNGTEDANGKIRDLNLDCKIFFELAVCQLSL
jgi:hypothetical protein